MLAGLVWIDFQSQIPLASVPVTLLHGDGTRAGAEAETGAGADAGLPRDRRQQAQEINTSAGASLRSSIELQLEQGRRCCDDIIRLWGPTLQLEMPYLRLTVFNRWVPWWGQAGDGSFFSEWVIWILSICWNKRAHLSHQILFKQRLIAVTHLCSTTRPQTPPTKREEK